MEALRFGLKIKPLSYESYDSELILVHSE